MSKKCSLNCLEKVDNNLRIKLINYGVFCTKFVKSYIFFSSFFFLNSTRGYLL